jgi:hypothetical protein
VKRLGARAALAGLAMLGAGCDPVLNVFGSFFPAWVVCIAAGVSLAIALRQPIARLGLEPHLGPPLLVYPSLALLLTLLVWLLLFRS